MNAHYVKMKHKCVNKTNIKICIVEGGGGGAVRGAEPLALVFLSMPSLDKINKNPLEALKCQDSHEI